jgi:hypothetical protein
MSASKTAVTTRSVKRPAVATDPVVQEALQVTWLLKGNLKNVQIAYIRVGKLLARVRDEKLWAALKHVTIEDYAEARLQLGHTSLYRYLRVHDWIVEFHKEWLEPKPKGFIPELADVADLIWIENELAKKDLDPAKRAALEALRQKALEGRLRSHDLDPFRKGKPVGDAGLRAFVSKLRLLRKRGRELATLPPEVLAHLDAAIDLLANANALQTAGMELFDTPSGRRPAPKSSTVSC